MKNNYSDLIGMLCSGLCLLHCLAAPLLVTAGSLGVAGAILADEEFHWILVGPIWLLAMISFPAAFRQHRIIGPLLFAGAGVLLISCALFFEGPAETLATRIGGLCLIYAHINNWKLMTSLHTTPSATLSEMP